MTSCKRQSNYNLTLTCAHNPLIIIKPEDKNILHDMPIYGSVLRVKENIRNSNRNKRNKEKNVRESITRTCRFHAGDLQQPGRTAFCEEHSPKVKHLIATDWILPAPATHCGSGPLEQVGHPLLPALVFSSAQWRRLSAVWGWSVWGLPGIIPGTL